MKIYTLATAVAIGLIFVSCIKQEPLNSECDILSVSLDYDILNRQPSIDNDKVTIIVKDGVSLTSLAPEFTLTPGATISPASGTALDFTAPQIYTVTSEDGEWKKDYTVVIEPVNTINLNYTFDNAKQVKAMGGSFDVFYEVDNSGKETMQWASANAAYALTFQASKPDTYPTYKGENGVQGYCAVLVTRSTGNYGEKLGKPMAAGNLFMGKFDMTTAVMKPLQATRFGVPFTNVPSRLTGFYKFKPGETFSEPGAGGKLVPVPGKVDTPNIYAVLFETTENMEWLDGENVLSPDNQNIIATAELIDAHLSDEWVEFSLPFILRPGKAIDKEKLKAGRYSITVVMSSSKEGDYFRGAIGSTLQVDDIDIVCLTDEEE